MRSKATIEQTGDSAEALREIVEVAERHGCTIVVDESHSLGTHGPEGAGLCALLGLSDRVHFITASLAKAFAVGFGIPGTISVADLLVISFLAAVISSVVLMVFTVVLAAASTRYRWDPDNVMAPVITAFARNDVKSRLFNSIARRRPAARVVAGRPHQRLDVALVELHPGAALEAARQHHGAVADADEAADGVADRLEQAAHLAVAAFVNGHAVPDVRALAAAFVDRAELRPPVLQLHAFQQLLLLLLQLLLGLLQFERELGRRLPIGFDVYTRQTRATAARPARCSCRPMCRESRSSRRSTSRRD